MQYTDTATCTTRIERYLFAFCQFSWMTLKWLQLKPMRHSSFSLSHLFLRIAHFNEIVQFVLVNTFYVSSNHWLPSFTFSRVIIYDVLDTALHVTNGWMEKLRSDQNRWQCEAERWNDFHKYSEWKPLILHYSFFHQQEISGLSNRILSTLTAICNISIRFNQLRNSIDIFNYTAIDDEIDENMTLLTVDLKGTDDERLEINRISITTDQCDKCWNWYAAQWKTMRRKMPRFSHFLWPFLFLFFRFPLWSTLVMTGSAVP